MKLKYKGIFKEYDQLPLGELPPNAVKFNEPDSLIKLNIVALIFLIPAFFFVAIIMVFSILLHGELALSGANYAGLIGIGLAFLTILPHELLHAVGFGKDAEVEMYVSLKLMSAFVVSTHPITKLRFIMLSLLPNMLFGWFPLMIWAIIPYYGLLSDVLFYFSLFGILVGVGDYLNVYNATRQMPKGSMQQLSGFNSYWFMP